ncbi:CaiB/BaiF CoA transferase family protein [Nocardioides sp.]|uniref:CaiB/BaiF CoA transferase family protein n=1 Tax=Nocardioides sp. TaxID=35761 RepID=UPI003D0ADFC8
MKPLSEVRVLDVSQVLAGPFAAMMLGDLGCDVIKIEPPEGEAMRSSFGSVAAWGETPGFLSMNRNKRSVALDLKAEEGLSVFHRLAATSDVVIQNFRPGVAQRLGISYDHLKAVNPGIICCSISGFGSVGPNSTRSGYDMIAQAVSGIMSITGEPGRPPVRAGVPLADIGAGLFAVSGVLSALIDREQSGVGCEVEASLYDSALSYAVWEATQYWYSGEVPAALGSGHRMNAPYQAFRCADGYVTIGANNNRTWGRLCDALGHPEWQEDPRLVTAEERLRHTDVLTEKIEATIAHRMRDEVETLLATYSVPAGAVRAFDEVLDAEEAADDGMVQHGEYAGREVRYLGSPIKINGRRIRQDRRPPTRGEHSDGVLGELGLTVDEIGALRSAGVLGD